MLLRYYTVHVFYWEARDAKTRWLGFSMHLATTCKDYRLAEEQKSACRETLLRKRFKLREALTEPRSSFECLVQLLVLDIVNGS